MQMTSVPFWLMIVSMGDGGLAGLAVADDQLALAAADRRHAVDRLEAGLHRLFHTLAVDDAGRDALDRHADGAADRALAVERVAEGVDDAAEQTLAGRDLHDAAGAADLVAFLDLGRLAQQHGADVVLLEVQRHAHHAVGQLEQLAGHRLFEAVDAGDAVAYGDDGTDLRHLGLLVVALDLLPDQTRDFIDLDLHLYSCIIRRRSWSSCVRTLPS